MEKAMLDFQPNPFEGEKQTRSTQIRHGDSFAELVERAANSLAVDKSVFLRSAIMKEAERVLEQRSRHVLSPEDVEQFALALDTPPKPSERALAAATSYRQRVVHAD